MTLWESIVLGIVQGATEFLPVSSSGHLVLTQTLMGLTIEGVLFEVAVHLATLLSILLVYRERVGRLISGGIQGDREAWSYMGLLVVATIPAGLIGVFFKDRIEAIFDSPMVTAVAFLITGALMWSSRAALKRNPEATPTLRIALLMGFAQAFALIPGISRSGTTVIVGLWAGVAGREAAAFSFLMAIPAIAGAAVLQIPDVQGAELPLVPLLAGSVAAAVTGVLAIKSFVVLLQKQSFYRFAYYLWPLGVAFLLYLTLT